MAQSDTPLTRALAQCDRLTEALRREQARNVDLALEVERIPGLVQAYGDVSADLDSLQAASNERARRRAMSWRERVRRSLGLLFWRLAERFEPKG